MTNYKPVKKQLTTLTDKIVHFVSLHEHLQSKHQLNLKNDGKHCIIDIELMYKKQYQLAFKELMNKTKHKIQTQQSQVVTLQDQLIKQSKDSDDQLECLKKDLAQLNESYQTIALENDALINQIEIEQGRAQLLLSAQSQLFFEAQPCIQQLNRLKFTQDPSYYSSLITIFKSTQASTNQYVSNHVLKELHEYYINSNSNDTFFLKSLNNSSYLIGPTIPDSNGAFHGPTLHISNDSFDIRHGQFYMFYNGNNLGPIMNTDVSNINRWDLNDIMFYHTITPSLSPTMN